ncbi:hypothetical protein ACHAXT_001641 [Thalassiosira profunda]
MASSEGSREIEAAKKRLAAAKARASADAKALEAAKAGETSAKKMADMAKENADAATKNRESTLAQVQESKKEAAEAEKSLKEAEERWKVYDVDDSEDEDVEEGSSNKKQKKSDEVKEIVVEGCGIPGANGTYKQAARVQELGLGVSYFRDGQWKGKESRFCIYRKQGSRVWFLGVGHLGGNGKRLYYNGGGGKGAHLPPNTGWKIYVLNGKSPAPELKW